MLTNACCLVVGLWLGSGFSVWLVSGHVFIIFSVVIVILPGAREQFLNGRVTVKNHVRWHVDFHPTPWNRADC